MASVRDSASFKLSCVVTEKFAAGGWFSSLFFCDFVLDCIAIKSENS